MFNKVLDKALPEINKCLPLDNFVEITSVRPSENNDTHAITLEGVDVDGCRVTETYWVGCRDSDCLLKNVIGLKELPDNILNEFNKCGKELKDIQLLTIISNLDKYRHLVNIDTQDYVGGIYSYVDENVGNRTWRKFLVTEVLHKVFPATLRGIAMDDDGEHRVLEVSQLDLLERVADYPFLD